MEKINFYPRSPCGERPNWFDLWGWAEYFYPRSPCGERLVMVGLLMCNLYFYPRSPCGERHVPVYTLRVTSNFYPRSPCGERRCRRCNGQSISGFLSTLSLRRATWPGLLARPFFLISIHALLAESDLRPTGGPA